MLKKVLSFDIDPAKISYVGRMERKTEASYENPLIDVPTNGYVFSFICDGVMLEVMSDSEHGAIKKREELINLTKSEKNA